MLARLHPGEFIGVADRQRLTHRLIGGDSPLRAAGRDRQHHHRQAVTAGRQGGGAHLRHRLGQRHLRRHLRPPRNPGIRHLRRIPTTAPYVRQPVRSSWARPPHHAARRRRRWTSTKYAGTWYEQGSVKQFFSFGLVNTTATYTPQPGRHRSRWRTPATTSVPTARSRPSPARRLSVNDRHQHPAQRGLLLRPPNTRRAGQLLDPRLRTRATAGPSSATPAAAAATS